MYLQPDRPSWESLVTVSLLNQGLVQDCAKSKPRVLQDRQYAPRFSVSYRLTYRKIKIVFLVLLRFVQFTKILPRISYFGPHYELRYAYTNTM